MFFIGLQLENLFIGGSLVSLGLADDGSLVGSPNLSICLDLLTSGKPRSFEDFFLLTHVYTGYGLPPAEPASSTMAQAAKDARRKTKVGLEQEKARPKTADEHSAAILAAQAGLIPPPLLALDPQLSVTLAALSMVVVTRNDSGELVEETMPSWRQ
jgi:hypothetical protein